MMKRVTGLLLGAFFLVSIPAAAQTPGGAVSRSTWLSTTVPSCFPDNTIGHITPLLMRTCMATLANSVLFSDSALSDLPSGPSTLPSGLTIPAAIATGSWSFSAPLTLAQGVNVSGASYGYKKQGAFITPWINVVTDYGADPTGVADSTTAINNAITAYNLICGRFYIPDGIYKFTTLTPVTCSGGVIEGDGTETSGTRLSTSLTSGNSWTISGSEITIQNMTFQPVNVKTSGFELVVTGGLHQQVKNVLCYYCANGIEVFSAAATTLDDIEFRELNGASGLYCGGTSLVAQNDIHIMDIIADNPYPLPLDELPSHAKGAWAGTTSYLLGDIFLSGGYIWQVTTAGTSGGGAPTAPVSGLAAALYSTTVVDGTAHEQVVGGETAWITQDSYCNSMTIKSAGLIDGLYGYIMEDTANTGTSLPFWVYGFDVSVDHPYSVGIYPYQGQGVHFENSWESSSLTTWGITFGAAHVGEDTVLSTRVAANALDGIEILSGPKNIKLGSGLQICSNGQLTNNTYSGIHVEANTSYFDIEGVTSGSVAGCGTNTQKYALSIAAGTTSNHNVSENNNFAGNVTAAVNDLSTGDLPSLGSCGGGSPSISATATNHHGTVTEGTTATGCIISFAAFPPFSVAPDCVVSYSTAQPAAHGYTISTSALTITNTSASNDIFTYICKGL